MNYSQTNDVFGWVLAGVGGLLAKVERAKSGHLKDNKYIEYRKSLELLYLSGWSHDQYYQKASRHPRQYSHTQFKIQGHFVQDMHGCLSNNGLYIKHGAKDADTSQTHDE